MIASVMHNYYSDFLKSFKTFLGKVTNDSITYYEFDYGSKTVDYKRLMDNENFEYPTCIIELQDTTLIDNVSPIARNAMMNVNPSNHNMMIAENLTTYQGILLDKRWVNLMFTVTINVEDSASLLNYYDLFISQLPFNFSFYDYSYITYIDVSPFVKSWDFDNEDISNIFIRRDPTGYEDKYYAMIQNKPLLEMTSVVKNNDKESMQYSLTLSFETMLEVPNIIRGKGFQEIRSINVVIDTVGANTANPILIDIPDNILTNKNIEKGIILAESNFHLGIDGGKQFLQIDSDVDIEAYELALWVVEDSTKATSKRILIPLTHSKISKITNDDGDFIHWEIEFGEINWFLNFQFEEQFNFLNLILFNKQ